MCADHRWKSFKSKTLNDFLHKEERWIAEDEEGAIIKHGQLWKLLSIMEIISTSIANCCNGDTFITVTYFIFISTYVNYYCERQNNVYDWILV